MNSRETYWQTKCFGEVAVIGTGQVSPLDPTYVDQFYLGPENIESDTGRITELKTARELNLISGKYAFDSSAIVYSKIRPNLNKVCIPNFSGICSADMYPIWVKQDVISRSYLFYYMLSDEFLKQTIPVSMRTGMPKINRQDLEAVTVLFPPISEQHFIVIILKTWDRAIALTERRLTAAEQRKRGLMQQLLTGRVRFPEFVKSTKKCETKYGDLPTDWRYVPLKQVAREMKSRNEARHDYPVLSCTKHYGLVDSMEYFGRQIYSEDLSTYKVVRERQFAYATNHIEEGSIGYQDIHEVALISPMYTVFETNDLVDDNFLYKVLKTEKYRHIFEVNTNGTVNRRGSLRWDEFSQIQIPLPSLPEQRRIAAVLNTCDRELDLLRRKRDALQRQKKGLMQRLLTGRVRVRGVEA